MSTGRGAELESQADTTTATQPAGAAQQRVTRDVEPSAVRDLLEHPPRATLAFVDGEQIEVLPVRYRLEGDTHWIGIPSDAPLTLADREVVLVIDDGAYWFELRGISVRGMAARVATSAAGEGDWAWYAIAPRRVLAWDYGAIRSV